MAAGWTAARMPDLSGRTAIVTGANSGLGFEIALQLAAHGAHTILAARDPGRGQAALERIRTLAPPASVELSALDLADLGSVRRFAETLSERSGIDILVNNAGVMAIPLRRTADRFEMQIGTNHLGHFALTGLLLPKLLARPGARVVTMSSLAAMMGRINLGDLQSLQGYGRWRAYGQSKLANQLFTIELDRRARAAGVDLVSVASHPGYAATNLQTAGPRMEGRRLGERFWTTVNAVAAQSAAGGALPALYAATAPSVVGGQFLGPRWFGRGSPAPAAWLRQARDPEMARRLWERSEELTGVSYAALAPAMSPSI